MLLIASGTAVAWLPTDPEDPDLGPNSVDLCKTLLVARVVHRVPTDNVDGWWDTPEPMLDGHGSNSICPRWQSERGRSRCGPHVGQQEARSGGVIHR